MNRVNIDRYQDGLLLFFSGIIRKEEEKKWCWFNREIRFIELENVDDASISGVTTTGISGCIYFAIDAKRGPLVRHVCTRLCGHVRISETTF